MRFFAPVVVLFAAAPLMADVDVYLLAGQSNAHGSGDSSQLPADLKAAYPAVDYLYRGTLNDTYPLGPLISNSAYFSRYGPELIMGRKLDEASDNKVAIIKHARGSTTLGADWFGGGDATSTGDGGMLTGFYATVAEGMAALQAKYPDETINLKGLAWMQGESDAYNNAYANNYEGRLRTFTHDVRATLGDELPIAIGRLSINMNSNGQPSGLNAVRLAQAKIAGESPYNLLVDTDAATTNGPNDAIHFSNSGQLLLGELFAAALIPEPATLALPLLGGAAMLRRRGR